MKAINKYLYVKITLKEIWRSIALWPHRIIHKLIMAFSSFDVMPREGRFHIWLKQLQDMGAKLDKASNFELRQWFNDGQELINIRYLLEVRTRLDDVDYSISVTASLDDDGEIEFSHF